jgi:hypothetical protein
MAHPTKAQRCNLLVRNLTLDRSKNSVFTESDGSFPNFQEPVCEMVSHKRAVTLDAPTLALQQQFHCTKLVLHLED